MRYSAGRRCVRGRVHRVYRVLQGFTGFYRVLQGFTGFYRVLQGV